MAPHVDLLPLTPDPVPVRQEMQHRPIGPPGLVVVEVVLWEATGVEHTEMRAHAWPGVGRRFAAVIEPRPDEAAGEPPPRGEDRPPGLRRRRPPRSVHVIRAHVS